MTAAFDAPELLEELDGDLDFLAESVEILDEDAPKMLTLIREAAGRQDAESIAREAHTLKSMVGNFSATPAFESALAVEKLGRTGSTDGVLEAIGQLEQEVSRLQTALRLFLESANGQASD